MNSFEYIKKYAAMLAGQEYPVGAGARLFVLEGDAVYATKKGADLGNLAEGDIEKLPRFITLKSSQELRAAVISQTPACTAWLARSEALVPALDDMAQIIGTRAEVIDGSAGLESAAGKLSGALRTNAGCFVTAGKDAAGAYHGYTLTVGRTPYEAIVAMTVLEKSAEVTLLTEKLGGACRIAPWERKLMRLVYMKKYSKAEEKVKSAEAATAGSTEKDDKLGSSGSCAAPEGKEQAGETACSAREEGLRKMLVEYGKKLVNSGLVQGTWGNLSVRVDDKYMLATPSGLDYMRLTPSDMVKVNIDTLEYEGGLKPTSEKGLHAAVYKNRPDVGAIIHTHAKYCSVYAAAHKDLPVPPEKDGAAEFSNPVRLAAYALPGTKALMKNTAAAVGQNSGAIMANHGMIVCGGSLEETFRKAEALEKLAGESL